MKLSDTQITNEVNSLQTIVAYSGHSLPFSGLSDRNFEVFAYLVFKQKIQANDYDLNERFDQIDLMEGVGEQGRDSILLKNQKNTGVIQCKKIDSNIAKPLFVKELIKFLLHYTQDKSLIYDLDNFTYYFVVSKGLAGTTKQLIREFNTLILNEPIEEWTNEVLKSYKAFEHLTFKNVKEDLEKALKTITVRRVLPEDLMLWVQEMPNIVQQFFDVKVVTENKYIKDLESMYLKPILEQLKKEGTKLYPSWNINFKEYLNRSYEYYSSARTLVFGNQQKRLEDFYYPLELIGNKEIIKTIKYPDNLLPKYKKVIIVDTGGMGKSTVMKWLYTCAIREKKGIPIFIELRTLSTKHTIINEIVKQVSPLDHNISEESLLKVIKNGKFIFFLDGYDEIKWKEKDNVTKDINNFISKASHNEYIITSRPENSAQIFSGFQTFSIKPLNINDAYKLIEKIGNYSEQAQQLIKKIKEKDFASVKEFLKNPLLVSLLYRKFDYRSSIPLKKQEFYYEVFEALFQAHDVTKGRDYFIRPKKSGLSFSEFYKVMRKLGYISIQKNELEFNMSMLAKRLEEINNSFPDIQFEPYAFIEDLISTVPLFRREGLDYRWVHKSIQEYFAAEFICTDTKGQQEEILLKIYNGSRLNELMNIMDLCYDIDYKTFRNSVLYDMCQKFLKYSKGTFEESILEIGIVEQYLRDRQFRMFIEDTYAVRVSKETKYTKSKQLKTLFIQKKHTKKWEKMTVTSRISKDGFFIASVRKNINFRQMLRLLISKKNNLIRQIVQKDFQYIEKDGKVYLSDITLFDPPIDIDIIKINDDILSPVNIKNNFINISVFMKGSYFNYDECLNIVNEVEKSKSEEVGELLTNGFG